jgi:hypothetical protein
MLHLKLGLTFSQNSKFLPINDSTMIEMEGDQFSFDGMKMDQSKMEEKFLKKQKKYTLSPKEKALKKRVEENDSLSFSDKREIKKIEKKEKKLEKLIDKYGKKSDDYEEKETADSSKTAEIQEKYALTDEEIDIKIKQQNGDTLTDEEAKTLKKIEKKEKKLEKNGLEYSEGTDERPELLTVPTKKRSFGDFFKKYKFSVKKRTKVSKDQRKLTRLNKRCELNEEETDAKGKAESGYPLSLAQSRAYKKALLKDEKFDKKSKKIQQKQFKSIQTKEVQKRMKKNEKETKKRDNKRSRKKILKKIKYTLMFWKD